MGYCSEIAAVFSIKKGKLEEFKKMLEADELLQECISFSEKQIEGDDNFTIYWDSVKWDDDIISGYPEVIRFKKFLEEFDFDDETCILEGIHFIRIGEDPTDVEELVFGDPQHYAQYNRSIDISGI